MNDPILNISIPKDQTVEDLISKEWLVTNGLGGYASGTVIGINTRRHHGLFIPNLSSPRGRTVLLPLLEEHVILENQTIRLNGVELSNGSMEAPEVLHLKEFRLDYQTPTWVFDINGALIEKKIFMPYGFNSIYVSYRLLEGNNLTLKLRPFCSCRRHDGQLGYPQEWPFKVTLEGERYNILPFEGAPVIKMTLKPFRGQYVAEKHWIKNIFYRTEAQRGLDYIENLGSPGFITFDLKDKEEVFLIVSTESWESIERDPQHVIHEELDRRQRLLAQCDEGHKNSVISQLVLAADQFIILPRTRHEKNSILSSEEQKRTVIAGYHWFTDWGRDTMISLEGLTLCTGRHNEAKAILQTFSHYVKDGLLPNHFFEGEKNAIYNTVDATFWYFHAIDRYFQWTRDKDFLITIYPILESIIEHHVKGTHYGIHMNPQDCLIEAASEGYQLTWMDAKVDEWVVTPRRGKPVEIQALWFNAIKLMETWGELLNKPVGKYTQLAQKVSESFNSRFWFEKGGYLYDVIDSNKGQDESLRPNQILALSLRFPILEKRLWKSVVDTVEQKLLTPYGLRTLDPKDKDYHPNYSGNRWERDAAYHQGLVWTWLIGPFIDAWIKVYEDPQKAQEFFKAIKDHLKEAGVGTISEIFDAEPPFNARGCIAQAWSVAEVLRCFIHLTNLKEGTTNVSCVRTESK